ncbi:MAG TPA: MFS transporter, partial [Alcanivorax sp.]|nr:MFS transporter [Alcanivorax sp.]
MPWRDPLAWRMALFLGTGSVAYMSLLAWLVPFYVAQGHSQAQGAALLTVFTGAQIAGALLVPPLAQFSRDRRPALAITLALLMVGVAGF